MNKPNNDSPLQELPEIRPGFKGYWWVAGAFMILGLIMFQFDKLLSEPDNLEVLPGDLKRFVSLAEIFAHGFGISIIALGIWTMIPDKRKYIPRIIMCAAWPPAGVHLIKMSIARSRPICFFKEDDTAEYPTIIFDTFLGWFPDGKLNMDYYVQSFPSGHTATTWGLAIGMTWVFPKGRWLFFILAMIASVQRISSYAHWPSDVCFGAAIAFIMGGAMTHNWGIGGLLTRLENRKVTRSATPLQSKVN